MDSYSIGPITCQGGIYSQHVYYVVDGISRRLTVTTTPARVLLPDLIVGRQVCAHGDGSVLNISEYLGLKPSDVRNIEAYHIILGSMALRILYWSSIIEFAHPDNKTAVAVTQVSKSGGYGFHIISPSGQLCVKRVDVDIDTDIAFWIETTGMNGISDSISDSVMLTKVQNCGAMKTVQGRLESVAEYLSELEILATRKEFGEKAAATMRLWGARLMNRTSASGEKWFCLTFADDTSMHISDRAWIIMITQLYGILLLWREQLLRESDAITAAVSAEIGSWTPIAVAAPAVVAPAAPAVVAAPAAEVTLVIAEPAAEVAPVIAEPAAEVVPVVVAPAAEVVPAIVTTYDAIHPSVADSIEQTPAESRYDSYGNFVLDLMGQLGSRDIEVRMPPGAYSAHESVKILMKLGRPRTPSLSKAMVVIYTSRIHNYENRIVDPDLDSNLVGYHTLIDFVFDTLHSDGANSVSVLHTALAEVEMLLDLEDIIPISLRPLMLHVYRQRLGSLAPGDV